MGLTGTSVTGIRGIDRIGRTVASAGLKVPPKGVREQGEPPEGGEAPAFRPCSSGPLKVFHPAILLIPFTDPPKGGHKSIRFSYSPRARDAMASAVCTDLRHGVTGRSTHTFF